MDDRHRWYRTLGALVRHGVPLDQALDRLSEAMAGDLGLAAGLLAEAIRRGDLLSMGMQRLAPLFDPLALALVESAERGGSLPQAFADLGDPDLILGRGSPPAAEAAAAPTAGRDGDPVRAASALLARAHAAAAAGLRLAVAASSAGVVHLVLKEGLGEEIPCEARIDAVRRRFLVLAGIPYWALPPREGRFDFRPEAPAGDAPADGTAPPGEPTLVRVTARTSTGPGIAILTLEIHR